MKRIAIINYGMGNLRSVENAVSRLGFKSEIITVPKELDNFDKIILPGVGSFKKAMELLKINQWIDIIKVNVLEKKKHLFGICLGMQLLASESEEFGVTKGLNLIEGKVKKLSDLGSDKKIPQIGWNSVFIKNKHKYLNGVPDKSDFYFVNSFVFVPENKDFIIAETDYGVKFCSAIAKDNIFGTQFHPEKSSNIGRRILQNFLNA